MENVARIVNLCKLQNVLNNFNITHVQFANFWPKPDLDPHPIPNPDLNPNPNPSQIVQHILQIAQTHKLCAISTLKVTSAVTTFAIETEITIFDQNRKEIELSSQSYDYRMQTSRPIISL